MAKDTHKEHFFGTATVGERGQVVIPAKARKLFKLKPGDHLFVFGMGEEAVCLANATSLKKLASHFGKKLDVIYKVLNSAKHS